MMGTRTALPRSRPSRNSRLLIASVVLTFALVGGGAGVTYIAYQQATAELVLERDRELAFFSANRLESELAKLAEGVGALARTEAVNQGNFSAQRQALEDARHRLAVYDAGTVLMDSRGIVIGTEPWRPEIHGRDWSNRPFFSRLLTSASVHISDVVEDGPDGQEVVVSVCPSRAAGASSWERWPACSSWASRPSVRCTPASFACACPRPAAPIWWTGTADCCTTRRAPPSHCHF